MKKLKIEIWNVENVVLMKVIQQDESLRGKRHFYTASNNIELHSCIAPKVYLCDLGIRGTRKELDNNICCHDFDTVQEAEEYVEKVKEAVEEYNESIREVLDNIEKEYLKGVIKPFRDKVEYIRKVICYFNRKEYIEIKVDEEYTQLPSFKVGTMYKGMETDREYTLKELGL